MPPAVKNSYDIVNLQAQHFGYVYGIRTADNSRFVDLEFLGGKESSQNIKSLRAFMKRGIAALTHFFRLLLILISTYPMNSIFFQLDEIS
jgi:hypothetical protein